MSVSTKNDRMLSVKLGLEEKVVNIVCAYAPQVGCEEEVKEDLLRQLDQETTVVTAGERVIVCGDFNGHVGRRREAIETVHGGWGVGETNAEGEQLIYFAVAFDLTIMNTFYEKKANHSVTCSSGERESQIDFTMCRRSHLK